MTSIPTLPPTEPTDGSRATPPTEPGQLWAVSWGGEPLGLVLAAIAYDAYFIAWPVTDESVTPSEPCFKLATVDAKLVCWPEVETGMSNAVLESYLGQPLTGREVREIRAWVRGDDPVERLDVYPARADDDAEDALALVCNTTAAWGELDSPGLETTGGVLSTDFVDSHGVDAVRLNQVLGGVAAITRDTLAQRRLLDTSQASAIADAFGAPVDHVWSPPSGLEAVLLRTPEMKQEVVETARSVGSSEDEVRAKAWEASLIAARQERQSHDAVRERVRHALRSMRSEK
ncbi:hypothetical protein EF847_10120 [Actinobacteria bacterium YIM 96077]|uniref:Uncharacterized protein n=1 Tax=Phytoactinopolyspora halophila TaxID=1981511 RepID=A0A329QNH0_9ACTN|nr:hypothetical protein [Phytoactinopolyspora halophila]AYY13005.1 hypothetical protein EF847_10120 [Actinobacteria bacterium YIM 96077]RAW13269.1 hypothetical protein DPM12_13145 [Phytoactinopolyspora halophila]